MSHNSNRRWWRRRGFRPLMALALLAPASAIVHHVAMPGPLPPQSHWQREFHRYWLNWTQPCRYHRYRTADTVEVAADWIAGACKGLGPWDYASTFHSAQLGQQIAAMMSHSSDAELQQALANWSVPAVGEEYAQPIAFPFTMLLFRQHRATDRYRYLHIRVLAAADGGSWIEIWDLSMSGSALEN